MKSKLEQLTDERNDLASRIQGLQERQKKIRADMEADPRRNAAALAPRYGELQTQIEVFTVKLEQVAKQIEAEQKRLNSPEVRDGIKRAEQIIASGQKVHDEMIAQAEAMIAKIDAALGESQEAASLLKNAGRDFLPYSGTYTEVAGLRQVIGGWLFARSERANMTAGFKQLAVDKQAREAAKAQAAAAAAEAQEASRKQAEARAAKEKEKKVKRGWALLG